jgi:hypothetical protein
MLNKIQKRPCGRTGPRSIDGKAIVARNALKTGVFARVNRLLPHESQEEYAELVAATFAEWTPVGPSEEAEVWTIIGLIWRGLRWEQFQVAITTYAAQLNDAEARAMMKPVDGPVPVIPSEETMQGLSVWPRREGLKKLHSVESHLSRMLDRSHARLERLQARRETRISKTNLGVHPRIAEYIA